MIGEKDERVKQAVVGIGILLTLTVVVTGLLAGWRSMPGVLGEWIGTMLGIMTTPFFMESSFLILGLGIVISLNVWRRHKEGDDFVYLEQVTGPDVPADLPEHAKWALYREKPMDPGDLTVLEQAEGAVAIGDHEAAASWLATMSEADLKLPETLRVRRDLALATGRTELADSLSAEIRRGEIEAENGRVNTTR